MARRATRWALLSYVVLAGAACSSGGSKPCGSGQVQCGGCYDPAHYQTDPFNCGGCGIACGAGATCAAGLCQCAAGQTRCDALSPRCRDLQTDAGACGTCSTDCTSAKTGATCQSGACGCFPPKPDDCGPFCTNTQTDPANCGTDTVAGCNHPCKLRGICTAGTCGCPPALIECTTACADLQTDPENCGSCGKNCPAVNQTCSAGSCTCPATQPTICLAGVNTPERCVNLATDAQDCGTCGNACAAGAACASGTCSCPTGEAACNNACVPCAAGAACCPSGSCQTQHSNGLGQFYFDCNPLYAPAQTTIQAATAAAHAWMPGTPTPAACDPVYCISLQTGSQCAVWCTAGSNFAGRVELDSTSPVCVCPNSLSKTWN